MNEQAAKQNSKQIMMHVISGLHVGGAEMMLYRLLSNSQLPAEQMVIVSLTQHGELASKIRQLDIEVIELQRSSFFTTLKQLKNIIDKYQPYLIQSWLYRADLLAGFAAKRKKIPVIWNVRQTQVAKIKSQEHIWLGQRINAILSKWLPKKIVYCAQAARHSHENIGFAKDKGIVIANGVDTEKYVFHESLRRAQRQSWDLFNNDVLIGMVGRFDPLKNHKRFIRVLKQVIDACPQHNIKAVLVGRGINQHNHTLVQQIQACQLKEHFLLIDQTEDVVSALSAMDIHVLTSDNEGWPNVLGEAMSVGLPCVATNVGDVSLMLYDKSAVIDIEDENRFVQKVIEYINLPSGERWKLAKANREFIHKNSSLETTVKRYDDLYLNFS